MTKQAAICGLFRFCNIHPFPAILQRHRYLGAALRPFAARGRSYNASVWGLQA